MSNTEKHVLALQTCHKWYDFACFCCRAKESQQVAMVINAAASEQVQLGRASQHEGQRKLFPFCTLHLMTYHATDFQGKDTIVKDNLACSVSGEDPECC